MEIVICQAFGGNGEIDVGNFQLLVQHYVIQSEAAVVLVLSPRAAGRKGAVLNKYAGLVCRTVEFK